MDIGYENDDEAEYMELHMGILHYFEYHKDLCHVMCRWIVMCG